MNDFFQSEHAESNRILYSPSPFAKKGLISLQECGTLFAKREYRSQRESLSSYLFFIVVKGEGTVTYCSKSFSLSQGDCFFVDCSFPYSHQTSANLWQLKWVHFTGNTMKVIYEKFMQRAQKPVFHADDFDCFSKTIDDIYNIAQSDSNIKDMELFVRLSELLKEIMRQSYSSDTAKGKTKKENIATAVKEYIDEHEKESPTLDELAQKFFVNKFYLTRLFKKEYNMSIGSYVIDKKITQAKYLLRFSGMSLSEIAEQVGINEPFYFSRIFKRYEGVSPSEFRKSWKG